MRRTRKGVGFRGLNGLILDSDLSSTSLGLHAGPGFTPGFENKWTFGIIVRFLPTDVDFTVRQPTLSAIHEPFADDDDVVSVGLRIGRSFRR